jgi:glycosyltransferase involved in cell wall biosynthesis
MDLTIAIPAYNEGSGIRHVLTELVSWIQSNNLSATVIVINDGSTDNTKEEAEAVQGVQVVSHPYNKGYGAALKTGIKAAKTEWVLTYDSDGQHTPQNIAALLPAMTDTADLVIGKREGYKGPWIRQPGKRLIGAVANYLTETKIPDYNSGLRAFRASEVRKYLHLFPSGFSLSTTSTVCFLKERLNVIWTPITIKERQGKSTVRPRDAVKTFMLIFRLTMLFSPLRIFFPSAVVLGLITVGLIGYELIMFQNISDAGVALFSFTGILFFFGLLADQIAAVRREIGKHSS